MKNARKRREIQFLRLSKRIERLYGSLRRHSLIVQKTSNALDYFNAEIGSLKRRLNAIR